MFFLEYNKDLMYYNTCTLFKLVRGLKAAESQDIPGTSDSIWEVNNINTTSGRVSYQEDGT